MPPKEAPVDPGVAPEGPVLEPAEAGEEAELDEEEEEDDDEEGEEEEEEEEEEGQQEEAADGNNGGQGEGVFWGQRSKCMVNRGFYRVSPILSPFLLKALWNVSCFHYLSKSCCNLYLL